ncbi:DUF982 domain-containing protein [Rhizobium ruizarguesonis]
MSSGAAEVVSRRVRACSSRSLRIQTTQAATWALVEDWPTEEGPDLDRDCAVCADVMSGKRNREEARQEFIDAAIEAGIPIKE